MKIKIDKTQLNTLLRLQNFLMLNHNNGIVVLKEIKYKKIIENYGWKNRKEREVYYLIGGYMNGYNNEGHFLGTHGDGVLEYYLNFRNFDIMRNNFLNFQTQLKAFGFNIKKIEEPIS